MPSTFGSTHRSLQITGKYIFCDYHLHAYIIQSPIHQLNLMSLRWIYSVPFLPGFIYQEKNWTTHIRGKRGEHLKKDLPLNWFFQIYLMCSEFHSIPVI